MLPENIEDIVRMALYHPENFIRSKVKKHLEESPYRIRSCFECKDGVYIRLEERDGLSSDHYVCDIPTEYFGVKHPKAHPFIVTIAK